MDTKVNHPAGQTVAHRAAEAQRPAAPVDAKAAAPEKVDTVQAVPAVDTAQKPALTPAAPNSALTTYKDQDSGRLIVRVYDRESGDVLVEFPPEKAFRPAVDPERAAARSKKSFLA
ncbi:MAG TPA: flagellar protein FlaG [Kiloniellaceae bacterium]